MTTSAEDSLRFRRRARDAARRALDGDYDLLLACRDLAALKAHLRDVPDDVVDTFVGVASEVDDLPIGGERRNWSLDALMANDVEANRYREQVRDVVTEALRRLLGSLGNPDA